MSHRNPQDALEIELIRSLFEARSPTVIMSACFVGAGGIIAWETGDAIILLLLIAGVIASLVRLAVIFLCRSEAISPGLTNERARHLQRRFTVGYLGFAAALGMFCAHTLSLPDARLHMVSICLLMGYGSGVAARVGLRPMIAIPSLLLAVTPALTAALAHPDMLYWAMSVLTCAFLLAGINSINVRYAHTADGITRRLAYSTLARRDGLTALPNRLALREWFEERVVLAKNRRSLAVHYLDLDGFKPVNDQFGHAIGDALLIAVSERIAKTIRKNDTAARLGGDEFAIVQSDIDGAEEALLLAHRIAAAISHPYHLEGHTIAISTCVGFVIAEHGAEDLECLLSLADEALYVSKRQGGGVTQWHPELNDPSRAAA